jgi:predicted nucleic-acid-binding protein
MIAIDTNVLLRYLLADDDMQSSKAQDLILGNEKVLITDVVLTETIWTLKGKRYNLRKEELIDVIHALFSERNLVFEDGNVIWSALKDFTNAPRIKSGGKTKQADFPDALIINKSFKHGQLANDEVTAVYTFDKAALEIKGTKLP